MEIQISDPKINGEREEIRRFSYYVHGGENRRNIPEWLAENGVTPKTHPKVADIFAGDGSGARILIESGWNQEEITCFDRYKSPDPLVDADRFKYWDLERLHADIKLATVLPQEILAHKGEYDLVLALQGEVNSDVAQEVAKFFLKPETGYIYKI